MDNYINNILKRKDHLNFLIIVLIIFFSSLTLYVLVGISNQIKKGRFIGTQNIGQSEITVSSSSSVYAKPDTALLTLSVIKEEKTVSEALEQNAKVVNSIIDFIKKSGVKDKDVKTTDFSIHPRYAWREKSGIVPEGRRVLVGYEVRQSLLVKLKNLDKIGDIIEGVSNLGADQVGQLQFIIDNEDELKDKARKEAITKAQKKAKNLAQLLGVELLKVKDFKENFSAVPVPRYFKAESVPVSQEENIPQIETGENKIEVFVTITYEIN